MLKGTRKYYFILASIFLMVVTLQYLQPKPVDWRRTYFKNDKIPFGCYAIYHLLETNYCTNLSLNKQSIYNLNQQNNKDKQTLILINDKIIFSKLDVKNLFEFIQKGNTVLMSANDFSEELQDTLNIKTETDFAVLSGNLDSLITKSRFEIRYIQPGNNIIQSYSYPAVANESHFIRIDTGLFKISAVNKLEKPVLIEAKIGKGSLLLNTMPDVFGNLFIADHPNRFYTYLLLSKLKNNEIIWDEHYKSFNVQEKSLFQFIFNNDSLYMAYSIILLGLLFFMLFELKRKQRSIPVIKPLQNSTLEFVDVISHVYFNSKNHKHIAEESIQYFYFDIRRKFNVNTSKIDDDFFDLVHKLSGISLQDVKQLFSYCENLKQVPSLTQQDLLELNNRINHFKQKSVR